LVKKESLLIKEIIRGYTMSKKTLVTGLVTGLLVGAFSTVLRVKTGVNV